jgi:hypothetical protein
MASLAVMLGSARVELERCMGGAWRVGGAQVDLVAGAKLGIELGWEAELDAAFGRGGRGKWSSARGRS